MRFSKNYLEQALVKLDFKDLTEVQKKVIPLVLEGKDLVVEAKTGSGKTHAYLLPVFEKLDETNKSVQVLICAPTKELAQQIFGFTKFIADLSEKPIDVRLYVGSTDRNTEISRLKVSQPQIAIGTPGKLLDLIRQENCLKSHTSRTFIVDEADMTLDEGFLHDVDQIASTLSKEMQMLVLSATIPVKIQPFLKKYLHNPIMLHMNQISDHNLSINHFFIKTKEQERTLRFKEVMTTFNPYLAIIFCNTKTSSIEAYNLMKELKYNVALINGDIPYRKRKQLVDRIHNLDFQYVVATDILSRGIDIDSISHIVNYELPKDFTFYIHRSGRTGRMGKDGVTISLYEFTDNEYIDKLESVGIKCQYKDVVGSELVDGKTRKERDKRLKMSSSTDAKANKLVNKPKKVKPGYKAKYNKEVLKKKKELFKKFGKKL